MEGVLTCKDSTKIIDILFNPFIIGIISGLFFGNLSLGMITTGFTILLWGYERTASFIIICTMLLVILTGNINFELIFLYFITITYLINQSSLFQEHNKVYRIFQQFIKNYILKCPTKHEIFRKEKNLHYTKKIIKVICYIIVGIFSLALFPLWRRLLGIIPVQVFNDINIAGNFLLIAAVFLSIDRFWMDFSQGLKGRSNVGLVERLLRFILILSLSVLAIRDRQNYVFLWIVGILILILLESLKYLHPKFNTYLTNLSLPHLVKKLHNKFLGLLIFAVFFMLYYLITLNLFLIIILIIMSYFLIFKVNRFPYLETIYILFFIGLLTARAGLLS